jgi:hypothetical protein
MTIIESYDRKTLNSGHIASSGIEYNCLREPCEAAIENDFFIITQATDNCATDVPR